MQPVPTNMTTGFLGRLRAQDEAAWFELWETFGPVLRAQLLRWGKGRVGFETARDLSQETMATLSDAIGTFDPGRGVRFSTWLLAIAKHVLGDELDRRNALKRGAGKKPDALEETWMRAAQSPYTQPDAEYEAAVFRAKVEAAIRTVERETDFIDFSVYRMRVIEGQSGKNVATALGTSEPTVSRRLARVRTAVRTALRATVLTYSFTDDERNEAARNGLASDPKKIDDTAFDEAVAEILHRQLGPSGL